MNAQTKWNGTIFAWTSIRIDLSDYFKTRFNN
jgi:putative transposase